MAKPLNLPATPIDPQQVFAHATHFVAAGEYLKTTPDLIQLRAFNSPGIVMSAFASELLLKCLLLIEEQPAQNGHNLYVLFRRLSNPRKTRIEQIWNSGALERPQRHRAAEEAMKAKMPQRTFAIPADLLTGLQECGDAFERMRYLYEDPMAALFYLNDLPRVLIEAILELRPDWTPAHQTQPTSQAR